MSFRNAISKASESSQGIWRLPKWAKDKSHKSREIPKMPTLTFNNHSANTFEEKAEMLKGIFFPAPLPADLQDIPGSVYPAASEGPTVITKKEVLTKILRLKPDTAPGPDGIPNRVFKACSETLTELLTPLFQACVNLGYHPRAFSTAHTITLKKAYRPIAPLNTLGKVIEAIMASKITHMAEKHELLLGTQMGDRRERSTESALELLTEQIHTVWGQGNDKVATLLSMDVAGAYDTVSHQRLIHNLRRRKIPQWVTNWIECFSKNRRTLTINRRTTDEFDARTGIPQGSPISPILYLFYNADLLDICNRPGTKTSGLGFVDDINVLVLDTNLWR